MRAWLVVLAVVGAGVSTGCTLIETPCGRVAGSICTIPGEESACRDLKNLKRADESSQKACEAAEAAAVAYAREPDNRLAQLAWNGRRLILMGAGALDALNRKNPSDKLEDAGRKAREAASEAGRAIGDMFEEMTK